MRFRWLLQKSAQRMGQVWVGLVALGVLGVALFQMMPSFDRGTILTVHGALGELYLFATLVMPGYGLYRWGSARLNRATTWVVSRDR